MDLWDDDRSSEFAVEPLTSSKQHHIEARPTGRVFIFRAVGRRVILFTYANAIIAEADTENWILLWRVKAENVLRTLLHLGVVRQYRVICVR